MRVNRFIAFIVFSFFLLNLVSCSKEDAAIPSDPFVVAFEDLSANLGTIEGTKEIPLVFSRTAAQNGSFTLSISSLNATYGEDFTTIPAANGSQINFSINAETTGTSFVFNKLNENLDETSQILFTISQIDYEDSNIQGNTSYTISNSASLGKAIAPELGGPNEGNQIYIDLSTETETVVMRDSWDLGFYSGDDFRVGLNGSIYMAAASLESINIDEITEADVVDLQPQVSIGTFDPNNAAYVDNPNGDILGTAIAEISTTESENKVYLLNLGYEVGTDTPDPGSVAVAGDARGWKKIRILRDGDNYILQYADLNDASHQEVRISKNTDYNFSFFSFNTNTVVPVEPEGPKWDVVFTVFTNVLDGAGSYGFSDGVLHNRKGGVQAYQVTTDLFSYESFSLSNVSTNSFEDDQRTIGSKWRDVFDGVPFSDRFYVLKDANGTIYKIKFLALTNDNGERGYPEFEYELLK